MIRKTIKLIKYKSNQFLLIISFPCIITGTCYYYTIPNSSVIHGIALKAFVWVFDKTIDFFQGNSRYDYTFVLLCLWPWKLNKTMCSSIDAKRNCIFSASGIQAGWGLMALYWVFLVHLSKTKPYVTKTVVYKFRPHI